MFKCPKCGAYMQWRWSGEGDSGYWICSQCGYSPNGTGTTKNAKE